jgi:hypothetical protein
MRGSIALRATVMLAVVTPLFAATRFHAIWWQILIAASIGSALGQVAVRATRGRRVAAIVVAAIATIIAVAAAGWLLTRSTAESSHRDGDHRRFLSVRAAGQAELTWDDVHEIERELPPAAPYLHKSAQLASEDMNWNAQVVGTTPDYLAVRDMEIAAGRPFGPSDGGKVVVLGDTVVAQLFGAHASAVGQQIRINSMSFEVIGVLAHQGSSPQGQDLDDVALVPLDIFTAKFGFASKRRFGGVVLVGGTEHEAELRELLRARHRLAPGDDDDFTIVGPTPPRE